MIYTIYIISYCITRLLLACSKEYVTTLSFLPLFFSLCVCVGISLYNIFLPDGIRISEVSDTNIVYFAESTRFVLSFLFTLRSNMNPTPLCEAPPSAYKNWFGWWFSSSSLVVSIVFLQGVRFPFIIFSMAIVLFESMVSKLIMSSFMYIDSLLHRKIWSYLDSFHFLVWVPTRDVWHQIIANQLLPFGLDKKLDSNIFELFPTK